MAPRRPKIDDDDFAAQVGEVFRAMRAREWRNPAAARRRESLRAPLQAWSSAARTQCGNIVISRIIFGRHDCASLGNSVAMSTPAIEALFEESRRFPPPPEFAAQANANAEIYEEAERDYRGLLGVAGRASSSG